MLLFSGLARAEDEKARQAREELERQLKALVGEQPTRVRIEFEPLDEVNFTLEGASFEFDGKALVSPPAAKLSSAPLVLWEGDVKAGKHRVHANLVYANNASPLLSDEGGNTWKVGGEVSFEVNAGIEVQVRVVPLRDPSQRDVTKRVRLSLPAKPVMLARVEGDTEGRGAELAQAVEIFDAGHVEVAEKTQEIRPPPTLMPEPPAPGKAPKLVHTEPPIALVQGGADAPGPTPETATPSTPPPGDAPAAPVASEVADASALVPIATLPEPSNDAPIGWVLITVGGSITAVGLLFFFARRRS
jgi:hypothetical protein